MAVPKPSLMSVAWLSWVGVDEIGMSATTGTGQNEPGARARGWPVQWAGSNDARERDPIETGPQHQRATSEASGCTDPVVEDQATRGSGHAGIRPCKDSDAWDGRILDGAPNAVCTQSADMEKRRAAEAS